MFFSGAGTLVFVVAGVVWLRYRRVFFVAGRTVAMGFGHRRRSVDCHGVFMAFQLFQADVSGRRCSCGCGICKYSAENYLSAKAGDIA